MLQDSVVFLEQRKRVLEVLRQALVEHEIESAIGERRLEGVAAHQFQIVVEIFLGAERINDLEAILCKIKDIDISAETRQFGTVAARTRTDFQHLQAFQLKILLNRVHDRRRRRIDLVHVVLPLPKAIPYGLIGLFN